jgi:hypothetical protein
MLTVERKLGWIFSCIVLCKVYVFSGDQKPKMANSSEKFNQSLTTPDNF